RLMAALSGSTVLLVIAVTASMLLGARLSDARSEFNAAEAELQAASAEHAALVTRGQRLRAEVDRLRKQALPIAQLLTRLADAVPDDVAITSLELKEDGGLMLEGDARAPQRVSSLLYQLANDDRFRTSNLEGLDASSQEGTVHFRVRTGLAGYEKG